MEYVRLGSTGLKVSRICLGTMSYGDPAWRAWVLPEAESRPFLARALEHGINFFDSADMYSVGRSEEIVGRALKDLAARDCVVIATKVFYPMSDDPNDRGLSRKHIFAAVDGSLRRLGTDYIDLYQIHRWDANTPIEETLCALDEVVRAGKVRYIGASSTLSWQLAKALYIADARGWMRFVSMQNHYNLAYREEEREMIPLCLEEGVAILPWSPLARGLLAGTRTRGQRDATIRDRSDAYGHTLYADDDFDVAERVVEIARERNLAPAQIALAWLLHKPGVTAPVVGATKLYQLDEAAAAVDLRLTPEEIARLEAPYRPHAVAGIE